MLEKDIANIEDCLFAIEHIEEYMEGVSSSIALLSDHKTYDAILMNFMVIAEASKRISPELKEQHANISWAGVRRFRNYIAHDYFGIDIEVVWQSLKIELPKLKTDLLHILDSFESKDEN
jgi:uncharacterized protein with HEPN domain